MKKIWIPIIVVVIIIGVVAIFYKPAPKGTIKIGAILPLSGFAANRGEEAKQGIDLAVEEFSKLENLDVKVIYEDSAADSTKAVNAANKLIDIDRVKILIGPLSSSEAIAVSKIAQEKEVVMITPISGNPEVTKAGNFIFRTIMTTDQEGEGIAKLIKELNISKIAIISLNNDYGNGIVDILKNKSGLEIVAKEKYNLGDKDFRSQLTKIKATNPRAVILIGYTEVGTILKQAKELGINSIFISGAAFEGQDTLKNAEGTAEGVLYVYHGYKQDLTSKFYKKYQEKFGKVPSQYVTFSYDTTKLVLKAIKEVGNDSKKISQYLTDVKDFAGEGRIINFDQERNLLNPQIIFKTVKNGQFVPYEE